MSVSEKKVAKGPNLIGIARLIWRLLQRKDKLRLGFLFALMLLGSLVEIATLYAVQTFMQTLATSGSVEGQLLESFLADYAPNVRIILLALVLTGIFLVKLVVFVGVARVLSRVVVRQKVELANRLFQAYQFAPLLWHLRNSTADLQRSLRDDVDMVTRGVILQLLLLLQNLVVSIAVLSFVLTALPGPLLIAVIATVAVVMVVSGLAHLMLTRAGTVRRDQTREMILAIQQGFGALTEARILNRRDWFQKEFSNAARLAARADGNVMFVTQSTPVVIEVVLMIAMIGLITMVILASDSLEAALALATVLAAAMFRLRQAVSKIANAANRISAASPALGPMIADLDTPRDTASTQAVAPVGPFRSLAFDNVSFVFPQQDKPAMQDVSLSIKAGDHVAIVGQTGAGKSTFLSLMLGLLRPSSGQVALNDQDLWEARDHWHSQIGYVPQSVYILDDTIAANVAFGIPEDQRDLARIEASLEIAQMRQHIASLPDGVSTGVGEGGGNLSGGQRQRIGIARALYHRPSVLVLDEATSALDRETQLAVLQALGQLPENPTVISVTHQVDPMRHSDQVIFLQDGRIEAAGAFESLLQTSEAFRTVTRLENDGGDDGN